MPIASTAEQRALQASIREWATGVQPMAWSGTGAPDPGPRQRAGRPARPGTVARRYAHGTPSGRMLGRTGGPGRLLDRPARGGGRDGGTVADLAAALEQLTTAWLPGPVMPTLLAGLLLAAATPTPGGKELLPALAAGQARGGRAAPGTIPGPGCPTGRCG